MSTIQVNFLYVFSCGSFSALQKFFALSLSNSVLYLFDPFTVLLIKLWIVSEFLLPRLYFLFALSHPIRSFSYLLSSKLQLYKLLMSFLLFRNLFWVIFSHAIFFKFSLPTWAFPVLKKFASKFISSAFAPPSRNNWLSAIGTFKKLSSLFEKETRNSEKLSDKFTSVLPRLVVSRALVKLCSLNSAFTKMSYFQLSLQHWNAFPTHVAWRAVIKSFKSNKPSPPSSGYEYRGFFAIFSPCVTKISIILLISFNMFSVGVRIDAT